MLVKLYREGALRQRIAKGYVIAGRNQGRALAALTSAPLPLPDVLGRPLVLRTASGAPGTLWLDTGAVWLYDPKTRKAAAHAIAEGVSTVARELARFDCMLLPSAYRGTEHMDHGDTWLCPDLHAVEVFGDVQRELCANLFRQYSPTLLALAGRTAYGGAGGGGQGSRRLAETPDQLTTRYMHSCSPAHLTRVTEELGRDEGVGRLEAMDVNPLGDPGLPMENVSLRLFDGQQLIATCMAHALLSQALAVRVRRLAREGRRVGSVRQALIDRNRSRAIAQGLTAAFETESRTGGRRNDSDGERRPRPIDASDATLRLLTDLLPEFAALDATSEELSPLFVGLRLHRANPSAVRNENDLVLHWHRSGSGPAGPEMTAACLKDPDWLVTDHLTAANRTAHPGGTAVVTLTIADHLAGLRKPASPAPKGKPASNGARKGTRTSPEQRVAAGKAAAQVLIRTLEAPLDAPDGGSVIRQYLAGGGPFDLDRELRPLGRDRARPLRAALRPDHQSVTTVRSVVDTWAGEPSAGVCAAARARGTALLVVDVDSADEDNVRTWLRGAARTCGDGLKPVLLANTRYRSRTGDRRKVEVLVVRIDAMEAQA